MNPAQQRPDGTRFLESFYLESETGMFFAVKGHLHGSEKITAYLRYAPDPKGDRQRGGVRYRRLYSFREQEELLQRNCPECLFYDPVLGTPVQGLPRDRLRRIYDPRQKLAELETSENLEPLQAKVLDFCRLLCRRASVSPRALGVSGSVLVNLHGPASDLDVTVFGESACRAVRRAMADLLDREAEGVRRMNEDEMRLLYGSRSSDTPMDFPSFAAQEKRKVNQGMFLGTEYFLRFVPLPEELGERYGDRTYRHHGFAEIEARVADARRAIFTPCVYGLEDVHLLDVSGELPDDTLPEKIVSFRGRFCEQAREGERIRAQGRIERVEQGGEIHHRLLLGATGDTMVAEI